MALVLRRTKGSRLTWDEGDDNFVGLSDGSLWNMAALATKNVAFLAITAAGQFLAADGLVTTPSYSFASDQDTGFFWNSSGVFRVANNGAVTAQFATSGFSLASTMVLQWGNAAIGTADTILVRDAANTLAQRNGVNAQAFRLYNTFTDAANYERLRIRYSGNVAEIFTEQAGTGSSRTIAIGTTGAGQVQFYTQNAQQFVVSGPVSAVNFLTVQGNTTGGGVTLSAANSGDAAVDITYTAKGAANHHFNTGGGEQFRVSHVASAVNYLEVKGAIAADYPNILPAGSDTNIGIKVGTKGAANLLFYTRGISSPGLVIADSGSTNVNYIGVSGSPSGSDPAIFVDGTDVNRNLRVASKGAAAINLQTGGSVTQLQVGHVGSAVNFIQVTGNTTGNAPALAAAGSDPNIALNLWSKGTGGIQLLTNGGAALQVFIQHVASSVNYISLAGAATGGRPAIAFTGSDTHVAAAFDLKGTSQDFLFRNNSGSNVMLQLSGAASAVNYHRLTHNTAGNGPLLSAQGSDTNITLFYDAKGTGGHTFRTAGGANAAFVIENAASSVNWVGVVPAATAGSVIIKSDGSDTNIDLSIGTKGSGTIKFYTGGFTREGFRIASVASAVNYIQATPNATTFNPYFVSGGSDTNIGLELWTKGTGTLTIGTNGVGSAVQFQVLHTAGSTRNITITGSNGGNPTLGVTAGSLAISTDVVMAASLQISGASIIQNSQSAAYTTVAGDANKHILHPSSDNNARTFTIAANASVAYAIGTAITFVNKINTVTIAINSDTLTLAGAGTTGSRTLAANGVATALKISSTEWIISGTGLT